jgi:SPP1 gp7 family putative phage head morphogenesis protein
VPLALRHQVALHPRGNLLRRRRDRRLGALHASPANVRWYAQALGQLVATLRSGGEEAVRALRPHWPIRVAPPGEGHDAKPPTIRHEVGKVRARLRRDTAGFAPLVAAKAIRKNLGTVDDRLAVKIHASLGIQVRQQLTESDARISKVMQDSLAENVDLITSVRDDYVDDVEDVLSENWNSNGSWEDAVAEVAHVGDVTESRAELIARDQTMKMNARFNQVRQQSLGVTRYEWQTVGDDRVREAHQDLEGTEHDWDDPPTDADGNTGPPGDCGINCRCAANPILDLDEIEDDDAEELEEPPDDEDPEDV